MGAAASGAQLQLVVVIGGVDVAVDAREGQAALFSAWLPHLTRVASDGPPGQPGDERMHHTARTVGLGRSRLRGLRGGIGLQGRRSHGARWVRLRVDPLNYLTRISFFDHDSSEFRFEFQIMRDPGIGATAEPAALPLRMYKRERELGSCSHQPLPAAAGQRRLRGGRSAVARRPRTLLSATTRATTRATAAPPPRHRHESDSPGCPAPPSAPRPSPPQRPARTAEPPPSAPLRLSPSPPVRLHAVTGGYKRLQAVTAPLRLSPSPPRPSPPPVGPRTPPLTPAPSPPPPRVRPRLAAAPSGEHGGQRGRKHGGATAATR